MTAYSPKRSTIIALSVGAALSLALAASLLWEAYSSRRSAIELAGIRVQQFAQVKGDAVSRAFEMADMIMVASAGSLDLDAPETAVLSAHRHHVLRRVTVFSPLAEMVQMFGPHGTVMAESRMHPSRAANVANDYFFSLHRDGGAEFNIDSPIARTEAGPWVIPISRRLSTEDGDFAGVLRVLLSSDQLADSFEAGDGADADRLLLVGMDGAVYADSAPRGKRMVGRHLSQVDATFSTWSPTSGLGEMSGWLGASYRLPDFPFIMVALRSQEQVLKGWQPLAAILFAGAGLVMTGTIVAGMVIVRQEGRRAAIVESLRLRERAIEAIGNGVIITDARAGGEPIIYANAAFSTLTGYRSDEVFGLNPRFLHGPDTAQQALEAIRTALAEDREAMVVLRNYRKDGSAFWCELLISPVRDEKGRTTHHLGIQRDVTDRFDAEERMRKANTDLAASNAELEQFAYVASHDLQEPLRMVASYVQLLQRRYADKLDADANDFIGFAVDGVKRMQELIIDLLEYSRIVRRGKPFQVLSLTDCLGQALTDLSVAIKECQAVIDAGPLPEVSGDFAQLRRLLENLVGNAIKYRSPDRTPFVSVAAEREGDCWRISVSDNGIGIDPQYFERIFVLFQRLHPRDRYPGTGIGLTVCKRIIDRHGGKMWLDSKPGEGSTFYFTLPAKLDEMEKIL